MNRIRRSLRHRVLAAGLGLGTACQFGGCDLGEITVTNTVSTEDFIISTIRGLILTPIDNFVTNAIENAFDDDE